jgi:hypothetical protein
MERAEIERLKRIDLISYLESMGFRPEWKKADKAMFYSPLRPERNPSFYVYCTDRGWFWKDWGTGESGDIIKFVELYYGVGFLEAVERLSSSPSTYFTPSIESQKSAPQKDSVDWVREFYRKESFLSSKKIEIVKSYFIKKGVNYYSEMKCIPINDRKEGKLYVGIPVPFPLKMRGLELREVNGNSRKTWGRKCLWLLLRNPGRFLVAESILDALSGEIILDDYKITLCSLNGVTNVSQLGDLFTQYRPEVVVLALDADEAGEKATREACEIAGRHSISVIEFTGHIEAGVKDLHKLLLKREQEECLIGDGFTKETILSIG